LNLYSEKLVSKFAFKSNLYRYNSGGAFGEMSLLTGARRTASVGLYWSNALEPLA
jgi:hypothetical protein